MGLKGILIALVALVQLGWTGAAAAEVGAFERGQDVGTVGHAGSVRHDSGRYRVTGGGANIWGEADAFQYVWTRRSGDLHIAADIAWDAARPNSDPHRKAGLMIRQNLSAGSPYADVMVHGDGSIALQYREAQDGPTRQIIAATNAASARVRLEREGDYVYFSIAGPDGPRPCWRQHRIRSAEYHVGLAVSFFNDADRTATAERPMEVPSSPLCRTPAIAPNRRSK
jgi:hypothetical protein